MHVLQRYLARLYVLPGGMLQPLTQAWVVGWRWIKVQVIQLACTCRLRHVDNYEPCVPLDSSPMCHCMTAGSQHEQPNPNKHQAAWTS